MTSQRLTTSNHCWNNVVYVNVEVYNVEQRQINVVCFNIGFDKVRQRRINISHVNIHNVVQRQNNVVNMTNYKKLKNNLDSKVMKYFWVSNKNILKLNTLNSKFWLLFETLVPYISILRRRIFVNLLKLCGNTALQEKDSDLLNL